MMSGNTGLTAEQETHLDDGAVVCDALGMVYRVRRDLAGHLMWVREGAEYQAAFPRRPLVRLDNPPQVP